MRALQASSLIFPEPFFVPPHAVISAVTFNRFECALSKSWKSTSNIGYSRCAVPCRLNFASMIRTFPSFDLRHVQWLSFRSANTVNLATGHGCWRYWHRQRPRPTEWQPDSGCGVWSQWNGCRWLQPVEFYQHILKAHLTYVFSTSLYAAEYERFKWSTRGPHFSAADVAFYYYQLRRTANIHATTTLPNTILPQKNSACKL